MLCVCCFLLLCFCLLCIGRVTEWMNTVVLAANMHTLRSGEHTRPRYSEDTDISILRSSISTPLWTFSAQFAIDNSTFDTDNFQERLHWWGIILCPPRAKGGFGEYSTSSHYGLWSLLLGFGKLEGKLEGELEGVPSRSVMSKDVKKPSTCPKFLRGIYTKMLHYIHQTPFSSCTVEGGSGDETTFCLTVAKGPILDFWQNQRHIRARPQTAQFEKV